MPHNSLITRRHDFPTRFSRWILTHRLHQSRILVSSRISLFPFTHLREHTALPSTQASAQIIPQQERAPGQTPHSFIFINLLSTHIPATTEHSKSKKLYTHELSLPRSGQKSYSPFKKTIPKHNMSQPPTSPTTNLPPLLALPLELQQKIFSHFLDGDDDDELALVMLRRTHSSLRQTISRATWAPRRIELQFHAAERKHRYLFPLGCYPCYGCLAVRPRRRFGFRHEGMGSAHFARRRCVDCARR